MTLSSRILLTVLAMSVAGTAHAQSLTGVTGLVTIPTADMPPDGTLTTGLNVLHRSSMSYHDGLDHAKSPFVSLVYLPFLETGLRLTRAHSDIEEALGDRTAILRLRVLKEGRLKPALLIGMHDFIGSKRHFQATYSVASKSLEGLPVLDHVSLHLGYGTKLIGAELYEFVGAFGGVAVAPIRGMRLLAEYVSGDVNVGLDAALFDRLHVIVGLTNMRAVSGGVAYSFELPH